MNRRLLRVLFLVAFAWMVWSLVSYFLLQSSIISSLEEEAGSSLLPSNIKRKELPQHHVIVDSSSSSPSKSTTRPISPSIQNMDGTAGFIHLGKTGGSNLARLIRNGCHSMKPKPCKTNVPNETIISKLVQEYYHIVIDTANIRTSNHSIFIISSRDVYDRFVSAFIYLHPRNKVTFQRHMSLEDMSNKGRAYKCFRSLEQFVDYVGETPNDFQYPNIALVRNQNCTNLARAIVAGRVTAVEHMYNNYQNILQWIPVGRDIYIIRQEHIWDDWMDVNRMLGHEGPIILPHERVRRNVTTEKPPPVTKDLSPTGVIKLCHALAPEYAAYLTLLQRAKNIKDEDIQESVEIGQRRCPNVDMRSLLTM